MFTPDVDTQDPLHPARLAEAERAVSWAIVAARRLERTCRHPRSEPAWPEIRESVAQALADFRDRLALADERWKAARGTRDQLAAFGIARPSDAAAVQQADCRIADARLTAHRVGRTVAALTECLGTGAAT